MKIPEITKVIRFRGLAFRYGLYILSSILVIFIGAFFYTFTFSFEILLQDARNDASNVTKLAIAKIRNILQPVEDVPTLLAKKIEHTGDINGILLTISEFIAENKEVYGSSIAFEPYLFDPKSYYYAPYQYERGGVILTKMLGDDQYDYFNQEWYRVPAQLGQSTWSEPYFDKGGGDLYMCTYAVPFYRNTDGKRVFSGVVTMDISLASLRALVDTIHVFESGFGFLISRTGKIISYPDAGMVNKDISALSDNISDTNVRSAIRNMLRGESGFVRLRSLAEDKPSWMYYAPVTGTNWVFGLVFPSTELLSSFVSFSWRLLAIFVASIVAIMIVIFMISRKFTKPIKRLVEVTHRIGRGDFDAPLPAYKAKDEIMQLSNSFSLMQEELRIYISRLKETMTAKERMESELNVARTIQMGLLPGNLPRRDDCEISALLEPAKEVGGDLYDFILTDDDMVYLAIGDVSGKGVPGALFMAIVKTLFRSRIGHEVTLCSILESMNCELSRENPNQIFVTFLAARINLTTGGMELCNAGHMRPVIKRRDGTIERITYFGGIPLGIYPSVKYSSGKVQLHPGDVFLCYTDGITEANNNRDELFGESRLLRFIEKEDLITANRVVDKLVEDVRTFAGDAEQSDDMAILVFKYNNHRTHGNEFNDTGEENGTRLLLVIKNRIPDLNILVTWLSELSERWNIPDKARMHINLALEELVTNIIFHGFDDSEEHEIRIDFLRRSQGISITVEDEGKEFDILEHEVTPDMESPAEEREIGGLGVHFIREIMDEVSYERIGNTNKVVLLKNF